MKLVPNAVSNVIARQGLKVRANAPSTLFVAGVTGMVGSTVLACRATLKMDEVLEMTREDISMAKAMKLPEAERNAVVLEKRGVDLSTDPGEINYSNNDYRRDIAVIYARCSLNVLKEYAPAILLGAASVTLLTKSHDMLNKRNAALTAAYVAVDEAFDRYRERVVEKYGEEEDREFRYGYEEIDIVDSNGRVDVQRRVSSDGGPSMYARFFDEYSPNWSKEPEYNFVFLRCQQQMANNMLRARGHLFLNEVYDNLGLDRTQAGSVVGWIMSPDSDNYVDFGLFSDRSDGSAVRDFVNGREGSVLLDFNVDGVIFDKIDANKERPKWQS